MSNCVRFIAKYTLLIVNLVFLLLGIGLLVVGIFAQVAFEEITDVVSFVPAIPAILMSVGGIVTVISFCGCCGAAIQNKCMLYSYSVCMSIFAGFKIWLATVIFGHLNNIQQTIKDYINDLFRNTPREFSALESLFQCCGTTGHEVYPIGNIPRTCCAESVCTPFNSFDGCNSVVADYFDNIGTIIGAAIIGAICFEVVAIVFAVYIANVPKKSNKGRVIYVS